MGVFRLAVILLLAPALLACAGGQSLRNRGLAPPAVELETTPFYAQEAYQCGPAALATVLGASGAAVTPAELVPKVYLPARRGSLQAEIVAATRTFDRVPYVLAPDLDALLGELAGGKPVLVLLNLGLTRLPAWHYAVVIGYDSASDSLLLRSGTTRRMRMSRARFLASWTRAAHWALVTPAADEIPATANSHDWLRAASAFESLGRPAIAATAYAAATRRWPEAPIAWQALASARYTQGDAAGAETALRRALQLSPSAAAWNNLAQLLRERGCHAAALAGITRAEAAADAAPIAGVLANTRAGIDQSPADDAPGCP